MCVRFGGLKSDDLLGPQLRGIAHRRAVRHPEAHNRVHLEAVRLDVPSEAVAMWGRPRGER